MKLIVSLKGGRTLIYQTFIPRFFAHINRLIGYPLFKPETVLRSFSGPSILMEVEPDGLEWGMSCVADHLVRVQHLPKTRWRISRRSRRPPTDYARKIVRMVQHAWKRKTGSDEFNVEGDSMVRFVIRNAAWQFLFGALGYKGEAPSVEVTSLVNANDDKKDFRIGMMARTIEFFTTPAAIKAVVDVMDALPEEQQEKFLERMALRIGLIEYAPENLLKVLHEEGKKFGANVEIEIMKDGESAEKKPDPSTLN